MRQLTVSEALRTAAAFHFAVTPSSPQLPPPKPLVLTLRCPEPACPLLEGAPWTMGNRSGFVSLTALIDGQPKQDLLSPRACPHPAGHAAQCLEHR